MGCINSSIQPCIEDMHTYIRKYVYVYIHIYESIREDCMWCINSNIQPCIEDMHTYIRTYVYVYTYTWVHEWRIHVMTAIYSPVLKKYIHRYIYIQTPTYIYIYVCQNVTMQVTEWRKRIECLIFISRRSQVIFRQRAI